MTSTTEHMRVRVICEDGMAHHTQVLNAETNEPLTAVTSITLTCDANSKGGAIWRGSLEVVLPRCDITADADIHVQCEDALRADALLKVCQELQGENHALQARIDALTTKTEA